MPRVILTDPDPYQTLAERYLALIEECILLAGLSLPASRGVTMVRPAEDCCPDLTLWVDNIRPFDLAFPGSLGENRILQDFAIAFDINVRFGWCYTESQDGGVATDMRTLQSWTRQINDYINPIYTTPIFSIAEGCIEEFGACGQTMLPTNLMGYNMGLCAGYEYAITFGLFT